MKHKKSRKGSVERHDWLLAFLNSLKISISSIGLPGIRIDMHTLFQELQKSRTDVDRQVREATLALQNSSQLISNLETALQEKIDHLVKLRREVDRYSNLSEIKKQKAKALVKQLEVTLGKDRRRERTFSIIASVVIAAVFFFLGALLL